MVWKAGHSSLFDPVIGWPDPGHSCARSAAKDTSDFVAQTLTCMEPITCAGVGSPTCLSPPAPVCCVLDSCGYYFQLQTCKLGAFYVLLSVFPPSRTACNGNNIRNQPSRQRALPLSFLPSGLAAKPFNGLCVLLAWFTHHSDRPQTDKNSRAASSCTELERPSPSLCPSRYSPSICP